MPRPRRPARPSPPREIAELPVNGRNYLDLLQLVPGVAINRQVDPNTDRSNPVLGERSGNNNFLIDGQSNKDTVNGGPAQQFNQETIAEFQVLTSGYKAEFGQASGAIVNVITKSGGNLFSGVGSLFFRDDALDASNSLDQTRTEPLPLRRYDSSIALGGPLVRDKVFFFGSAEHISEERQLDFKYPDTGNAVVNELLREQEAPYDVPTRLVGDARVLQARRTPRTAPVEPAGELHRQRRRRASCRCRRPTACRRRATIPTPRGCSLGFGDTALLGNPANPYVVTLRAAFRRDDSETRPSQTDLTGSTLFNPYDSRCTTAHLPDLRQPADGHVRQHSHARSISISATRSSTPTPTGCSASHDLKFGMNFLRTGADGVDARLLQNQLFATHDRLRAVRRRHRRPVPARRRRRSHAPRRRDPPREQLHRVLRAGRLAAGRQPDGQPWTALGLRLGIRSQGEFRAASRRLVVGARRRPSCARNFGVYYDQFRLGLARNVPAYGGTDQRNVQYMVFPRGVLRLAVVRVEHRAVERPAGRLLLEQPGRQPHRRADHGRRRAAARSTRRRRSSASIASTTSWRPAARRFRPTP